MKAIFIQNDKLFLFEDGQVNLIGGIEDTPKGAVLRQLAVGFAEQMGFLFLEEQELPAEIRIVA